MHRLWRTSMVDMSVKPHGNDGGGGLVQQDFLDGAAAAHANPMSPDFKHALDAGRRIDERERMQALRTRGGVLTAARDDGSMGDEGEGAPSAAATTNQPFAQAEQALRNLELATHDSVTERLLGLGFGSVDGEGEDTFVTRTARARKAAAQAKLSRRTVAQRARDATYAHYMRTKARDRWQSAEMSGEAISVDERLEGATGRLAPPPMSDEHNYGADFDWDHQNNDHGSGSDDDTRYSEQ